MKFAVSCRFVICGFCFFLLSALFSVFFSLLSLALLREMRMSRLGNNGGRSGTAFRRKRRGSLDRRYARGGAVERALAEALLHEEHELLLALVRHLHVLDELRELERPVLSQSERLAGLRQEIDKVAVMARTDVRQSRVRRIDVRRDCRVK